MKIQKAVRQYTLFIAGGVAVLTAVMLIVFALAGRLDLSVVLGALWGAAFAVLNFFLMSMAVQAAAEIAAENAQPQSDEDDEGTQEAEQEETAADNKQVRQKIRASYSLRMLMMVAAALIALIAPCFHTVAAVLPMLFPRIVIMFQGILNKKEA